MNQIKFDVAICGAGVVGIAIARQIAITGKSVILLEKNQRFGMETSSRNSEVIHAGIYYPEGSNKARFCVRGKNLIYEFCEKNNIHHKNCGKYIIATDISQLEQLSNIKATAHKNGIADVVSISQRYISENEPDIHCLEGLFSPSTGILDSHSYMNALLMEFEDASGLYFHSHTVSQIECHNDGISIDIKEDRSYKIFAEWFVNSGGLHSTSVAKSIVGFEKKYIPDEIFVKGRYFSYAGPHQFKHHIYPVPENGGLGIHATIGLDGCVKFGPDALWYVQKDDLVVEESIKNQFFESIKRYFPKIDNSKLSPGYAGIRPKLNHKDTPAGDFTIQCPKVHGIKGVINLFGIESPGLTSSLAIAEYVNSIVQGDI